MRPSYFNQTAFAIPGAVHPRDMGQREIEGFLAMLANERRVALRLQLE